MVEKTSLADACNLKEGYLKDVYFEANDKEVFVVSPNEFVYGMVLKNYEQNQVLRKKIRDFLGERKIKFISLEKINSNYASPDYIVGMCIAAFDHYPQDMVGIRIQSLFETMTNPTFWDEVEAVRKKWGIPPKPKYDDHRKIDRIIRNKSYESHLLYPYRQWLSNRKRWYGNRKVEEEKIVITALYQAYEKLLDKISLSSEDVEDPLDPWQGEIIELARRYNLRGANFDTILDYIVRYHTLPEGMVNNFPDDEFTTPTKKHVLRDAIIRYYLLFKAVKDPNKIKSALKQYAKMNVTLGNIKVICTRIRKGYSLKSK